MILGIQPTGPSEFAIQAAENEGMPTRPDIASVLPNVSAAGQQTAHFSRCARNPTGKRTAPELERWSKWHTMRIHMAGPSGAFLRN